MASTVAHCVQDQSFVVRTRHASRGQHWQVCHPSWVSHRRYIVLGLGNKFCRKRIAHFGSQSDLAPIRFWFGFHPTFLAATVFFLRDLSSGKRIPESAALMRNIMLLAAGSLVFFMRANPPLSNRKVDSCRPLQEDCSLPKPSFQLL